MKALNTYIQEGIKLSSKSKVAKYNYHPKDKHELKELIKKLIKERGNDADLNDIDVSQITDMSYVFMNSTFDGDISNWDVSNVEYMNHMFYNSKFNGDISNWNVSKVKDMSCMFSWSNFDSDISNWDASKAKNIDGIFFNCPLHKNPPKWWHK